MSSQSSSSTRTAAELRKAAHAAGWEGDKLSDEILTRLAELEAQSSQGRGGAPYWAWVAVGLAVIGCSFATFQSIRLGEAKAERQGYAAAKEAEISSLKAANLQQIEAVTSRLSSVISAAEGLTKTSATAADSNQAAVALYMNEFQKLLEDYKKAREGQEKKP